MGIEIKRNKKGEYALSNSGSLHPDSKFISSDECKRILIERAYAKFIIEAIGIYSEFPNGYYVNGKLVQMDNHDHLEWVLSVYKKGNSNQVFKEKFNEVVSVLGLDI